MPNSSVDRGWAWVIMTATFINQFLCAIIYTVGIFNVIFLEEFRDAKAITAGIGALMSSLMSLAGPLAGVVVNKTSHRVAVMTGGVLGSLGLVLSWYATGIVWLLFTFGVVQGLGLGLAYSPSIMVVSCYFRKYRGMANGFVVTGMGVGIVTLPLVITALVDEYGWRGCLLILAGFELHFCVTGMLMRPVQLKDSICTASTLQLEVRPPPDDCNMTAPSMVPRDESMHLNTYTPRTHEDACTVDAVDSNGCPLLASAVLGKKGKVTKKMPTKKAFHFNIFANAKLLVLYLSLLFQNLSIPIIFMHLPDYLVTKGMSVKGASTLLTITGITSLASRLLAGVLMNFTKMNPLVLYALTLVVTAVTSVLFPMIPVTFFCQAILCLCWGLSNLAYSAIAPVITMDIVTLEALPTAYGMLYLATGVGFLVSPPIAGWLYDKTQHYAYSFYLAGGLAMLGALVLLLVPLISMYNMAKRTVTITGGVTTTHDVDPQLWVDPDKQDSKERTTEQQILPKRLVS